MRPRTQKQPQVKKELCRVLDDVDVDIGPVTRKLHQLPGLPKSRFLKFSSWCHVCISNIRNCSFEIRIMQIPGNH